MRFVLVGGHEKTLDEIGEILGVSKQATAKAINKALAKLKNDLEGQGDSTKIVDEAEAELPPVTLPQKPTKETSNASSQGLKQENDQPKHQDRNEGGEKTTETGRGNRAGNGPSHGEGKSATKTQEQEVTHPSIERSLDRMTHVTTPDQAEQRARDDWFN